MRVCRIRSVSINAVSFSIRMTHMALIVSVSSRSKMSLSAPTAQGDYTER